MSTVRNGAGKESFILTRPFRTINYEGLDEAGLNLFSFRKANKTISKMLIPMSTPMKLTPLPEAVLAAQSTSTELRGRSRTLARRAAENGEPPMPAKKRPPGLETGATPTLYHVQRLARS